jgi:hypothetical protein
MKNLLCILSICLALIIGVQAAALGKERKENPSARLIDIRNESGRRFDVLWIDSIRLPPPGQPKARISNNEGEGYPYGGQANINSYVGHEFEIQEMPSKKTNECMYAECRKATFVVNNEEDQGERSIPLLAFESDFGRFMKNFHCLD